MNGIRCGVVSTMKNESPYIVDWFAHHVALGFERFVIATNDCEDTTNQIIKRLGHLTGMVEHHATIWRRGGLQRSALRQAYFRKMLKHDVDWVYVCDVDEYLNSYIGNGSVQALISAASDECDVISVPWRIFGPSSSPAINTDSVTKSCLYAETLNPKFVKKKHIGKFRKSIFRVTDKIRTPGTHMPHANEGFKLVKEFPGGNSLANTSLSDRLESFGYAQVNHYALRSLESYLVKVDRGRVNHTNHVMGISYWNKFNKVQTYDDSIFAYSSRVETIKQELLQDGQLRKLIKQGLAWHRNKIVKMVESKEYEDLILFVLHSLDEIAEKTGEPSVLKPKTPATMPPQIVSSQKVEKKPEKETTAEPARKVSFG